MPNELIMCLSLVAFFFPPLAVCFKKGCGSELFAAFCLTLLGWFPGCLYACCVIHQEQKGGGDIKQITNINMVQAPAAPAAPAATHVVVNLNESAGRYPPPLMHQPIPQPQPQMSMPMPMTTTAQMSPPPTYAPGSGPMAPPYNNL